MIRAYMVNDNRKKKKGRVISVDKALQKKILEKQIRNLVSVFRVHLGDKIKAEIEKSKDYKPWRLPYDISEKIKHKSKDQIRNEFTKFFNNKKHEIGQMGLNKFIKESSKKDFKFKNSNKSLDKKDKKQLKGASTYQSSYNLPLLQKKSEVFNKGSFGNDIIKTEIQKKENINITQENEIKGVLSKERKIIIDDIQRDLVRREILKNGSLSNTLKNSIKDGKFIFPDNRVKTSSDNNSQIKIESYNDKVPDSKNISNSKFGRGEMKSRKVYAKVLFNEGRNENQSPIPNQLLREKMEKIKSSPVALKEISEDYKFTVSFIF